MGLLDFIRQNSGQTFDGTPDAQFEITVPPEMLEGMTSGGQIAPRVSRSVALQVPAVLRSRNLIAGTLARLPMHIRDKQRQEATPTTLLEQIDPDIPNVVTFSQTYEDLLFEGLSWWRVLDRGFHGYPTYAEHIGVERVFLSFHSNAFDGSARGTLALTNNDSPTPNQAWWANEIGNEVTMVRRWVA
jgi:hypothetical protein